MEYTVKDRAARIVDACLAQSSTDPVVIFENIAKHDFVRMHGPEHHILDGAALLAAFRNAGGRIDLPNALAELMNRGLAMPGAICGHWGVCGAVSSLGAALSILDGTGPLSTDGTWGEHMSFCAEALGNLARINGPRCCKRDAFLSLRTAIDYVNTHHPVQLPKPTVSCRHSNKNAQCIKERCPFWSSTK
ncbi:MAG: hypothetical protein IKZ21_05235 [Clostridia bacterium]|nr:hypothetical protein [Clostridia bacterium]